MMNLPLAHVNSYLLLDGNKYEIVEFNVVFIQPTDHKGQPQHEMNGGRINITIPHIGDNTLYEWSKSSTTLKNGEIIFETEMSSHVMRVGFYNAYCIQLEHQIKESEGTSIRVVISPEILTINDIEHNNFWEK